MFLKQTNSAQKGVETMKNFTVRYVCQGNNNQTISYEDYINANQNPHDEQFFFRKLSSASFFDKKPCLEAGHASFSTRKIFPCRVIGQSCTYSDKISCFSLSRKNIQFSPYN